MKGGDFDGRRATRRWLSPLALWLGLLSTWGCGGGATDLSGRLEKIWGQQGRSAGKLQKPRAIAINNQDRLYIVDMTGRIQVFTTEGQYLFGWRTPDVANGNPCGLSFDRDGNLLVADTHYFRVLFYTPDGRLLRHRTMGGVCGQAPGQFGFVTDAAQDSKGCYYVAEYGESDRVQKFSAKGEFLLQWGGRGGKPGQLICPRALEIDRQDHVWVADSCNHRIQVFDAAGPEVRLVRVWGEHGQAPGRLRYPYGLALDDEDHVYVCEFGNHRVQKFTLEGRPLGCWGRAGRGEGELTQPWAVALDRRGRVHVLDTYNHRVQRIRL